MTGPGRVLTGASRPDTIRRHNMALLLEQVHRHGPLTRAELTARLGLNRSTIGVLVSELSALGLLREAVPAKSDRVQRAGRPSHVVRPHPDGPYAVAVDVEVDQVTVAAVRVGGTLLARRVEHLVATQRSVAAVAGVVARAVDRLTGDVPAGAWAIGVGVSIPGAVRAAEGVVETAPNLGWHGEPFGAVLADALADLLPARTPVALGNDADLGALAEHLRGAGRDAVDLIYLTGRVGVGAGVIVEGRPLRGIGGLAGEVGHTVLDPRGAACHCGGHGCVEGFIGEAALVALAGRSGTPDADAVADVLAGARSGDPAPRTAVEQVASSLGQVLANLVNLLNPQVVVLGGVLADVLELAGPEVIAALDAQAMSAARHMVEVRPSGLGRNSSLLGAAELAFEALLADPATVVASCATVIAHA